MKPQLMLDHSAESDCLRAAIATILNENIANVPHFTAIQGMIGEWDSWYLALQDWLAARGLAFVEMTLTKETPFYSLPNEALCLFAGNTPKGQRHVIVGKVQGGQFLQLFDPSPQKPGIVNVDSVCFLVPLDPALIHDQPTLTMGADLTVQVHKETIWQIDPADPEEIHLTDFKTEQEALDRLKEFNPGARLRVIRTLTSVELLEIPREDSASAF